MRASRENKKSVMAHGFRIAFLAVAVVTLVTGCTKKKELANKVGTTSYLSKATFEGKVFAKVRGVEEADSRSPFFAVPGTHEYFGLVKVRITERELQLLSVYNPQNREATAEILASYPIVDHFDIKREENDFKEQTHRVVEDREKPWQQRKYVRVDWSSPTNRQSRMAVDEDASTQNTVLLEPAKVENGTVVWKVETSLDDGQGYRYSPWRSIEATNGYRVTYRNYLMPVEASPDFQAVPYTMEDFGRFGYFVSQQNHRHQFRGVLDTTIKRYTNIFNVCEAGMKDKSGKALSCSTNKITWHLNKGFPDKYRNAAKRAVADWNDVFQKALKRSDDVVVLSDVEVDGVDPRYNIIHNYTPDVGAGLCGIAQKVEDPRTGQVLSARAAMFEGCNRGMLARIDVLIDLMLAESEGQIGKTTLAKNIVGDSTSAGLVTGANLMKRLNHLRGNLGLNELAARREKAGVEAPSSLVQTVKSLKQGLNQTSSVSREQKLKLMESSKDLFTFSLIDHVGGLTAPEAESRVYAKRAQYAATGEARSQIEAEDKRLGQAFNGLNGAQHLLLSGEMRKQNKELMLHEAEKGIHGSELVEEAVLNYLMKRASAMTPQELSSKREQIKAEADERIFYMVLLHEMGHTFGLRHNFHASSDKDNFHPEYFNKQKQQGVTALDLVPYQFSSVMDYVDDLLWDGGTSTYDLAAIKYVYNRGVDRNNDPTFWKTDAEGQKVPRFKFCTDHQAGEDLLCDRFDRGTTVSEITANRINSIKRSYVLSHFRRDRSMFDFNARYLYFSAIQNMVPIRQVMDEFIYKIVASTDADMVPSAQRTGSICDYKFFDVSVKKGELAPICDPLDAEKNRVNPREIGTFYNALFDFQKGAMRASPANYTPEGGADLLYANFIAQEFFLETIGAPEPGTYAAIPNQGQKTFKLHLLDSEILDLNKPQDKEAATNGLARVLKRIGLQGDHQKMAEANLGLVTALRPGLYAKHFSSKYEKVAGQNFLVRAGYGLDKMAAIAVLSSSEIGVRKYDIESMNGSPYVYPQTKDFVNRLMSQLVGGNSRIASIPVKVKNPKGEEAIVLAEAPATLNTDTKAIATITYLTDFVFNMTNTSAIERMRVCVGENDPNCAQMDKGRMVQFQSAQGNKLYSAYQTNEQDSIAYDLVAQAQSADEGRKKMRGEIEKAKQAFKENPGKLMNAEPLRARIAENMAKVTELAPMKDEITSLNNPESAWMKMAILAKNAEKIPLAHTVKYMEDVMGSFGKYEGTLMEIIKKEGGLGACENMAPATEKSAAPAQQPVAPAADAATGKAKDDVIMIDDGSKAPGTQTTACEIEKLAPRKAALAIMKNDMQAVADLVTSIISAHDTYHGGKIQEEDLTEQVQSKESHLNFILRVLNLTGNGK